MFNRTIDSKSVYEDRDGFELVDLGSSIFDRKNIYAGISSNVYKVGADMEMRPDSLSFAAYGNEEYTELLLKYNDIQNPFTIKKDDIMIFPSATSIEKFATTRYEGNKENQDALIRQFHKYVDKNKKPDTIGSEKNNKKIESGGGASPTVLTGNQTRFKEANLAAVGAKAIKEVDGRLYFGEDTGMKCAVNGINTSDYMREVIKNSTDKKK